MLKFLQAGLLTSIQDSGRKKFRDWGVPQAGYMDSHSAQLANQLVDNPLHSAVLEITMVGPIIEFLKKSEIAITGAKFEIFLNDNPIKNPNKIPLNPGDILKFGKLKAGLRAYLAIRGGILSPSILESQSYYIPITPHSSIKKGDLIEIDTIQPNLEKNNSLIHELTELNSSLIHVEKGPEFHLLNSHQREKLENTIFQVSNRNNRMAYALTPGIPGLKTNLITCPVLPGTVQLSSDGTLFILMRDGQTTGGYPRILQLPERSINQLAQLKTGNEFMLKLIS